MGHRSAYLLGGYVFAGDGLDDRRAGDVHDSDLIDHKDKVCERRAVDRTARAGARDYRELRDYAARLDVAEEYFSVAGERVDGFLDTGSAGIVDSDAGSAVREREVEDLAYLLGVHLAERAAHDGEVLAEYVDDASVYRTVARHDAVAEERRLVKSEVGAAVFDEFVYFHEAAGVKNCVDALARGHLAFVVLLGDGLLASADSGFLSLRDERGAQFVNRFFRHYLLPPHCLLSGAPPVLP